MLKTTDAVDKTANQTVRLDLGTKDGVKSIRIGFTDQRLTAHGGLAVWTRFITERGLREQLRTVLPHAPTSPNAYDPTDTALGFIGGILCGANKLAQVAHLAHDPAVAWGAAGLLLCEPRAGCGAGGGSDSGVGDEVRLEESDGVSLCVCGVVDALCGVAGSGELVQGANEGRGELYAVGRIATGELCA